MTKSRVLGNSTRRFMKALRLEYLDQSGSNPINFFFRIAFAQGNANRSFGKSLVKFNCLKNVRYFCICAVASRAGGNANPHQIHPVQDRFSICAGKREAEQPWKFCAAAITPIRDPRFSQPVDKPVF